MTDANKGPVPYYVISSILLTFIPSKELYKRVEANFGKSILKNNGKFGHQMYDMDIINRDFSCSGSILVLPKVKSSA